MQLFLADNTCKFTAVAVFSIPPKRSRLFLRRC